MKLINIFLFQDFETLDIFGPVEVLGRVEEYELHYYSLEGGLIHSAQGVAVATECIDKADFSGIFVIPGGRGTRPFVMEDKWISLIGEYAKHAEYCLSICTGSAVMAKSGILDGYKATSNKKAFDWVQSMGKRVLWVKEARWCVDGKFYTSAGVSAGIDMTLGFVADRFGKDRAVKIAEDMEYVWNNDASKDPFFAK